MTTTEGLVAFIRARLDEDEAAAKACQSPSPWKAASDENDTWIVVDATGEPVIYDEGTPTLEEAAHIARHDPARTLRAVEAKRRLMGRFRSSLAARNGAYDPTLAALYGQLCDEATVWSDHPDYRQAWRP